MTKRLKGNQILLWGGERDENVLQNGSNKKVIENNGYVQGVNTNISDNDEEYKFEREDKEAVNTSKDAENQVELSTVSTITSSITGGGWGDGG